MADTVDDASRRGPLSDVRVVELAGLAPGPFAATMLSDLGADVVRIDRPTKRSPSAPKDPLRRGRRSVPVDLKSAGGIAAVLGYVEEADVLIEPFRPGVCERLGIGPDVCLERNPRLVYGRLTGWGQVGPLAQEAGHDLCYLAIAGALHPIGPADGPPLPPINYVADFGGGGMLMAYGVLAALHERDRSGRGQVVDAAMVDGAGLQTAFLHGLRAEGIWSDRRGDNYFDGAAPFYRCYTCADGRYVAVGAVESQFYAAVLRGLELDAEELPGQYDRDGWPALADRLAERFATRSRDAWAEHFAGTDACVVPVLDPDEATRHPHALAREAFADVDGVTQPAPAPRFSRTPGAIQGGPAVTGVDGDTDPRWH